MTTFYQTRAGKMIDKDPSALLDYNMDWTDWLAGVADTIALSTWAVPPGLTSGANVHADGVTTIWLSGGTAGQKYTVTNQVTTAAGRRDERSFIVNVIDR